MTSLRRTFFLTRTLSRNYASSSTTSSILHLRLPIVPISRPMPHFSSSTLRATSIKTTKRWNSSQSSATFTKSPETITKDDHDPDALRIDAPLTPGGKPQQIAQLEPRLSITFTCTANECGHRSTHEFSKRSYENGIVLVQCPSCKSRHLIADHLGWFKESTEEGNLKTVEDLLRAKGEKVRRGKINFDGDIEYDGES